MSRHTPGPWTVNQIPGARLYSVFSRSLKVASVEEQADARLIAKAPELLGILRCFCDALDMSDCDHPSFADSGADVVERLWYEAVSARALLAEIDGGSNE